MNSKQRRTYRRFWSEFELNDPKWAKRLKKRKHIKGAVYD